LSTSYDPAGAPTDPPARCVLAGWSAASVPVESVPLLRKQPGPLLGKPLPVNFCKHADEQTVVGLSAVFAAIRDHRLAPEGEVGIFRDWGIVGAPRFLGRAAMATDLPRFLAAGAWEVSPHMIPHRSLHATSGTISQALKINGPNFGAGGGPGCVAEALLAGVALLHDLRLPGVWVLFTRLDPELPEDGKTGKPVPGTICHALALALRPAAVGGAVSLELTFPAAQPVAPILTIKALVGMLEQLNDSSSVSNPLGSVGWVTFRRTANLPGPHFSLLSAEHSITNR
jgi:hypothetical protein